jgi:ATP-dependent DNA ligase
VFEKLKPLVIPACPFVNLPETHKARWGEALNAEKMKKCVWVRPEVVAQLEFLEWTDADHLDTRSLWDCVRIRRLARWSRNRLSRRRDSRLAGIAGIPSAKLL